MNTLMPGTFDAEHESSWSDFSDFFWSRADLENRYLTTLDHDSGLRQEWTVKQWRELVTAVAGQLHARSVRAGNVVATLAGNTADALAAAYACWLLGAAVMPLNPEDPVSRQKFILGDSGVELLIYSPANAAVAMQLAAAVSLTATPVEDIRDANPNSGFMPVTIGTGGGLDVSALRIYTSGTTGNPKAVDLTIRNLLLHTEGLGKAISWGEGDRVMTVLPIHHVNGLLISCLLPWSTHASTVLADRFRSSSFWDDVESEGATVCSVVPSLLEFLLAQGGRRPDGFREVLCGAGPLLKDTVLAFEERFDVAVRHLYGLSETTAVATIMPDIPIAERLRLYTEFGFPSIGKSIPLVEVSVLDDRGNEAAANERGELAIRGGTVMRGYAGSSEANAAAFRNGWFLSGDEGFWVPVGAERFFFITGRRKELIIRGGVNIAPVEIDAVIMSHPAVRSALAIPFDNRFYGEEIAAFVVPAEDVDPDELIAYCVARLGYSRSPKVVIFGTSVPFTATGKAKRLELKRNLAEQLSPYRDVQFRQSS